MRHNLQWSRGGSSLGKPGYLLTFDYDAQVVEKLKATVPSQFREWRPEEKVWWVSELCEKQINDLFPGFIEAVVAQRPLF